MLHEGREVLGGRGPAPTREACFALESRVVREDDNDGGHLAFGLFATFGLGSWQVRELGERVAVLPSAAAREIVSGHVCGLLPWVATRQARFDALDDGLYTTEDLRCETRDGRLLGCHTRR